MPHHVATPEERAAAHAKLQTLADDGRISSSDMLELRRTIFPDGIIDRKEIELLFQLAERAPQGDAGWPALFTEICADFFLNEEEPEGYLTDEEMTFLRSLIQRDGRLARSIELHALVGLAQRARDYPTSMTAFVADQIKAMVAQRPTPVMKASDVELIRDFIYAGGGDSSIGVSRTEADFLFDLHDLTVGQNNVASWDELFVKAIAAHLMQHVGYRPIARDEALRLTSWAEDTSVSAGRFFGAMLSGGLRAIRASYTEREAWAQRNALDAAGTQSMHRVTDDEAAWLSDRIGRNGQFDDAERALLVYMRDHLEAELPDNLKQMAKAVSDIDAA
ncbi:MAG: hypothetical protein AAGH60_14100 [Pseudomonadota bacterium]